MRRESRGSHVRRYGRVARILIEDESLSDTELAKRADVNVQTAQYCRLAFNEVREALRVDGWRKG